jgi:dipeptidyl aminopeptidase/acylaminoacyl peptidase
MRHDAVFSIRRHQSVLLCLWAVILVAGPAVAGIVPKLPVEAFGTLPLMSQVAISPNGRYVAAMMLEANLRYGVVIFDLDQLGKKPPLRASTGGDWDVNWVHWKTDNRLLVSARLAYGRYHTDVLETRLLAVNADGSDLKKLVQPKLDSKSGEGHIVQVADQVVDFLPDDPEHILMSFNPEDPTRPKVYRVDVFTDQKAAIELGRGTIQSWTLDRQGRIRLAQGRDAGDVDAHYKTYYRATEKDEWKEIWDEEKRSASFYPVVFDKTDPDVVYVESDHENGRMGLYRYRPGSGEFLSKVFLRADVDLDDLILDPKGVDIDGVTYITDATHTEWLSKESEAIHSDVQARLPGWSVGLVSRTFDNSRMIVSASAPDHSGRYYLYEPATKKLQIFSNTYSALDEYDLARVIRVSYKARDGLEIPAYLTLPVGVGNPPKQPLPAVVMPHGGPESRDYGAFEPDVQMLANRGYAVLQMNFRGSTGYGSEFKEAGRKEWGEAMQDDVTDGTRWLVEAKIADPARICIVGGSYGGYAALMGVVKEQSLYKCAVSLNGVTDLPDLINNRGHFVGGRGSAARRIGDLWSDSEKLARNSPARRAADIRVPVLLVHGTKDRVVPPIQSRKMAEALKGAGKSYRYVELEDEEHWLTHGATRLQYYQELERFLGEHLR